MVKFVTLGFFRMSGFILLLKPNREANTKSYNQIE